MAVGSTHDAQRIVIRRLHRFRRLRDTTSASIGEIGGYPLLSHHGVVGSGIRDIR